LGDLLRSVANRASAVALAVAAAVSAALVYLTSNWIGALIIGLSILLAVLLVLIVMHFVRRERDSSLAEGLDDSADSARAQQSAQELARRSALEERFQEAVAEMRRDLRSAGRDLYDLPWLLVLGESGEGKSALLAEAGLDLPAQYARRGFGPTDTVDFVRANELTALDTAGRYLACETESDAQEWQRLLALLRRNRPDCPLEGIVFAISVETLLARDIAELEELARTLRRRLNEIRVNLQLDAPVYIAVTKADQLAGISALTRVLPPQHLGQAFGWTNDQRRLADAEQRVRSELAKLAERFDALLPELLTRELDADVKRELMALPDDLEALAARLARFVGVVFGRNVYGENTPFLRGVYLTSARAEAGGGRSPRLESLGASALRKPDLRRAPGALFLRELVLDVIRGDRELAQRDAALGPLARRAILGAAGVAALWLLWAWGTSWWQNYQGAKLLAARAAPVVAKGTSAADLDSLRKAIEDTEQNARSPLHWLGFHTVTGSLEDAKRVYVSMFQKLIERDTKSVLQSELVKEDEAGVQAAIAYAADISWLESDRSKAADAPLLEPYAPRIARALDFNAGYIAFARWLPDKTRADIVRAEQEQLSLAATRILKLPVLEEITSRSTSAIPPLRRTELGLPVGDKPDSGVVPGLYTTAGMQHLVAPLLGAFDRPGSVALELVGGFKRDLAARHDEVWRSYLLDLPLRPGERVDLATSPYLAFLDQVDEGTRGDVPGRESLPPWLEAFRESRRTLPLKEAAQAAAKGTLKLDDAPWVSYKNALESVGVEVQSATRNGAAALALAHELAQPDNKTEIAHALEVVDKAVPRSSDPASAARLRDLLSMPFLDACSAVLRLGLSEIEVQYREDIVKKFHAPLDAAAAVELCAKDGALQGFSDRELKPFLRGARPKPLCGDRGMPLGASFAHLLDTCDSISHDPKIAAAAGAGGAGGGTAPGSGVASGGESFTLTPLPSSVEGAPGHLVTSRSFEMACDASQDEQRYAEGQASPKHFECHPGCELTLRVSVADSASASKEVSKVWQGKAACSEFLSQGQGKAGEIREWRISGPDGSTLRIPYRVKAEEHPRAAPLAIQIPGGLGG
jgi:ImcF (intracellular multiplication and macrophage-killing)-related protein